MSRDDHVEIRKSIRALSPTLSVSMLTADLLSLRSEMAILEKAGIKVIHFDIMDGRFTPVLTTGPAFLKSFSGLPMLKDVHLMIDKPLDKVQDYVQAGADLITVHIESERHIHRVLQALSIMENANDPQRGIARGVALNPGTPLEVIHPLVDLVDIIYLLAVNPGWGGQSFIQSTARRVEEVKKIISNAKRDVFLGLDGGVTRGNIAEIASLGADLVVTGSAVFDGTDPEANVLFLLEALQKS
ncbi:MAG: ribulose-phosphate 3-epimerase [Bacillota bacterium]